MTPVLKRLFKLVFISMTASGLIACQPSQAPSGLVYCSEGNPESFNPQLVTSSTTLDATSHQIYDHLVEYETASGKVRPALATSWTISPDGKRYTFNLREGVSFHHSELFTQSRSFDSSDVVFSFNRVIDQNNPYHFLSRNGYPFFQSIDFAKLVKSIESPAFNKVVFNLNRSDASFLANMASDSAIVLSKEYADHLLQAGMPQKLDQDAIGTGPFQLKQYAKNEYIRYLRNDNYWGDLPEIKNLVFDITRKSSQRLAKLITGDCNVSALPKPSEIIVVEQNNHIELQQQNGMNVSYWAFNTQKPPFNNLRVRQALAMAINKKDILHAVYNDTAIEARGILPPASWSHCPVHDEISFSPSRARRILEEEGIKNLELDLWAMPTARAYNPNPIKTAQLMQADLARINVKVNIINYDWSVFIHKLNSTNYDSVLIGWTADNSDPDNFFSPFLSCASLKSNNNRSKWCSKSFDALLQQAKSLQKQSDRRDLYHQAETIIETQKPIVTLAHSNRMVLKRSDISGIDLTPFGGISFANAKHMQNINAQKKGSQ
ncbi:MAG: ABC transporter substrate-binding protein [Shewanella sp.]|nr:ABC transporter substrate-binding protein [Shewanella sp.]